MRLRLPSPAMVVALIALAVSLGGVGYAAVSLPPRSVTARELAGNAVTSVKVKDGSLLARDFRSGQLPAGPPGPVGPMGPAGPAGPAGSASVLSASVSALEAGKLLFKDDGTGAEIRTGAQGKVRFLNTSDDSKLDVRGLVYYASNVSPLTLTIGPGDVRDVGAETVSLTYGTFLLTRDVADAPRLSLTCGFKDSGTPSLVRLSCVGVR